MDKQISKLKYFSWLLGLILTAQIIGTVVFYRNSNVLYSANLKNIDSLITEIGQLKDENRLLDNKIENQNEVIQVNENALTNVFRELNNKVSDQGDLKTTIEDIKSELENEKTRLALENNNLNNLLDKKNREISKIKNQQQLVAQQTDNDGKVLAILFLGENKGLTDSIILILINPADHKTTLVSIPRDLYVNGRKINEYMEFFGAAKTEEIIKQVTGITVDKYVQFNFTAFTGIVDYLGGVNVQIDEKIADYNYPTASGGVKTVVFEPGIERMEGERALEYARSRKSTSDFDRSLRQQKVILALKNKLDTVGTLENLDFYLKAYQLIQNNLQTDLNFLEALQIYDTYKGNEIYAGNILSNANFLYTSRSTTGQSILLPKNGDFTEFQQKLQEMI
jgi:LCP family protein required for cell wall assembly